MKFNYDYYLLSIIPIIHLLFYQMKIFNLSHPPSCLKAFKSNNLFGLIIFLKLLIVKILWLVKKNYIKDYTEIIQKNI